MAHILPEDDHTEVAACVCGHDEQRRETLLEALSAWTPLAREPENTESMKKMCGLTWYVARKLQFKLHKVSRDFVILSRA